MNDRPLNVAFLWHMHQPNYKDPFSNVYTLPWVRLHGVKDYLDTLKILEDFPDIRQTFNVVPSLLDQLSDYVENGAVDRHLELTLKHPSDLTADDRLFIVENFFLANWDTMVKPYPRYYELLVKRGLRYSKGEIGRRMRYFSDQDIMDLQLLFNLVWVDPMFRQADSFLSGLMSKQKDYNQEEKIMLIGKQFDILKQIVPEYRKLAQTGQIEISVSPFYHPILPLLWDTDAARIAMPNVRLPRKRFQHPEDAVRQIKMGSDFFEKSFGFRPVGMWPSEGSVSESVAQAIKSEGFNWIATDEEVLSRSLQRPLRGGDGNPIDPSALYQPYVYSDLSIFFRDHKLSDQIGFVYSGWSPDRAVSDFIGRLSQIRESLPNGRPFIVPVILDGENAWEYYQNDGHDFLGALYRALTDDNRFKTVTISDYLEEFGAGGRLESLHAGSWINADFHVWIGHEEDNLSWDYLSQTRDDLETFAKENPDADIAEAWRALFAAEGSDWNWWYGDEHSTESQVEFDALFRNYLMKVYRVIGKEPPANLYVPILLEDRKVAPDSEVRGFIEPRIDGLVTSYYEWYNSSRINVKKGGGSMHKTDSCISDLYYGFNKDNLYVRIDPVTSFSELDGKVTLHLDIHHPTILKIVFVPASNTTTVLEKKNDSWVGTDLFFQAAMADIFEISVPFSALGAKENDEVHFSVEVMKGNGDTPVVNDPDSTAERSIERCPLRGHIMLTVPSADFEKIMWY
ncbi:MAG TPA: glycoside hydrolase family 57 protein [Dissulfurispiraceae bacterium]|nr:glycoside hydrolase family 57 protein [Dissulfurispiraceae bacterium]